MAVRWVACAAMLHLAAAQGKAYSQSQSQSFLAMTTDVLAAVAPSIDPIYKLAAQTSITFPAADGAHDRLIAQAVGGSVDYSIVAAQTVTYFRAYANPGEDALITLV